MLFIWVFRVLPPNFRFIAGVDTADKHSFAMISANLRNKSTNGISKGPGDTDSWKKNWSRKSCGRLSLMCHWSYPGICHKAKAGAHIFCLLVRKTGKGNLSRGFQVATYTRWHTRPKSARTNITVNYYLKFWGAPVLAGNSSTTQPQMALATFN